MITTTYTKIRYTNGKEEFGAFIDTGYGKKAVAKPVIGDQVSVKTKAGEAHIRIIRAIVKDYASGVKVAFVRDAAIEAAAAARYLSKATASKTVQVDSTPCKHCGTYCYGDCQAH